MSDEGLARPEGHIKFGDRKSVFKTYAKAIQRWVAAGMPERTDEEVAAIFDNHCQSCPKFSKSNSTCNVCGCKLKGNEAGLDRLLKVFGARAIATRYA